MTLKLQLWGIQKNVKVWSMKCMRRATVYIDFISRSKMHYSATWAISLNIPSSIIWAFHLCRALSNPIPSQKKVCVTSIFINDTNEDSKIVKTPCFCCEDPSSAVIAGIMKLKVMALVAQWSLTWLKDLNFKPLNPYWQERSLFHFLFNMKKKTDFGIGERGNPEGW